MLNVIIVCYECNVCRHKYISSSVDGYGQVPHLQDPLQLRPGGGGGGGGLLPGRGRGRRLHHLRHRDHVPDLRQRPGLRPAAAATRGLGAALDRRLAGLPLGCRGRAGDLLQLLLLLWRAGSRERGDLLTGRGLGQR